LPIARNAGQLKSLTAYVGGEKAQPASRLRSFRARHLFGEIRRHDLHRRGIKIGQRRQHLEDRTVGFACSAEGRSNDVDQFGELLGRLVHAVFEVAIGQDVEWRGVRHGCALDQHRMLLSKGMTDSELVEDVGVVDRDVAHDEIGLEDQAEHVLVNAAGVDDLAGGSSAEASLLDGRPDQVAMNALEVDLLAVGVLLGVEGTDDEGLLHWSRLPVSDQLPSCAASVFDEIVLSLLFRRPSDYESTLGK
jgi:hypothetical protein